MTPAEAAKLRIGDRVWVQGDAMLRTIKSGVYTVLDREERIVAGRRVIRIKVSDDPETWCRPQHLGRVSRGQ